MELIGRDAELTLLGERLRDRRLVTLVGPGGIGKTSLARAAARARAEDFDEGWVFVDLTRADSEAGVRETMAGQLGYRSYQALLEAPGDRSVLVVLDNCEHVVDAAAAVADDLLQACEMPTILATSRVALDLPGEAVVPLAPLGVPAAASVDAPAVRLFLERAADAGAQVEPSPAVSELCRRLDGMPLAIELAAARTRSLTPEEILARLTDSLDVLDRPRRRSAGRHRSIRSAIDWSFHLLSPAEQDAFARLSVIPGPFDRRFAHALLEQPSPAATDDVLDALVATSMLSADTSQGTTTYRMLETLRAFGKEKLEEKGATDAAERRLVGHVAELMADIVARGASGWAADALRDLVDLFDSAATAVRWCLEHEEPDPAILMTAVLWGAVHQVHTEEIGDLAEQVLARWPNTTNPLIADVAATAATCRYMMGDEAGAIALAEDALAHAGDSPFAGATLRRAIAQATRATGEAEEAIRWFEAAAAAADDLGLMAMALESESARAQILADLGDVDGALAVVTRVQERARADSLGVAGAWARVIEGTILLRRDPDEASAALADGRRRSEAIAYAAGISVAQRGQALACLLRSDVAGAAHHLRELLEDLLARGSTYELRMVLDVTSATLAAAGRDDAARDLAATALTMPVVSITASVGHELFPIDGQGGRPLPVRDAILLARDELRRLVEPPAGSLSATGAVGCFRRRGEVWEVGLGGDVVAVKDSKGMHDLATLLRSSGSEIHCLELMGAGLVESSTGEVLDARARGAYEERVRDLQAEIDEADANNDVARADRARVELDALVDQLTEALGLGGRSRAKGSSAERARSAVTQRIRSTIRRLVEVDTALGRHLDASVRTGTYCSYRPEHPVTWQT